jgi:DNA-binding LacI/PurR family transcriptional regulator
LTLVAQPTHEMGEQAVLKLIAQIEDSQGVPASLVLPNRIVSRRAWELQNAGRSLRVDASALD